ncbi:MAG: hypothetical protein ABSE16_06795 [Verrucomicrobiota bacterium]
MICVNLGAWPFQKAVVVKQFQPPQKMLWSAAKQGDDLMRTEKTMPVNEPDDLEVALRQSHGGDRGSAFEAGKVGCHRPTLPEMQKAKKT